MEYISHPLIKPKTVERRGYQLSLAASALMRNTLIVLPTGLGKTVVALLVIASRLLNEGGKVLFLAPTKPLVEQHANFLRKTLNIEEIIALSGEIPPEKRFEMYKGAKVVVSTPQVIENDIISGLSLKDYTLVVFDEAHRAVGNYSYVFIAKTYMKEAEKPLILGITASPGSDVERIKEVMENLYIEEVEVRTEYDRDVRPYVSERKIEWIKVEMPEEIKIIKETFEKVLEIRFNRLKKLGFEIDENMSKKELLSMQEVIQAQAIETGDQSYYEALSILAEILKVHHAIELLETQSIESVKRYLKRLLNEAKGRGSKASKSLIEDPLFREAVVRTIKTNVDHPKLKKLLEVVKEQFEKNEDSRIIVFANFRDTVERIVKELKIAGFKAEKFIGQANRENDRGMKQKDQIETLERFRRGELKILVSTSVGEEGLDIPSTDLVIFYEAIPSEIRAIQRKGRTGRGKEGRIVVLITKETRDETYYYSSLRKERTMYEMLYKLKEMMSKREYETLDRYMESGIVIYVDSREMKSGVVRKLYEGGVVVKIENLEVADYVLSDRVGVERKSVDDFLESIIDRKRDIFNQLINLKKNYSRPLLIIEGDNLYTKRRIHPSAIRGALASIAIDLGIPIIFTKDQDETAEMLMTIARREQEYREREITLHSEKTKRTLKEEMEYVVSAMSDVGTVIARNLLKEFQTIERIATASVEELMKVPKVGKKIAERIRKLMTTPYDEADRID